MIVWVIGAGGIGRVVAAVLADHQEAAVRLIPQRHTRVPELGDGLAVRTTEGVLEATPSVTALDDLGRLPEHPDLVLVCVKGDSTDRVIAAVRANLTSTTTILTLQNGLQAYRLAGCLGVERTLGAVLAFDGVAVGVREAVQLRADRRILVGGFRGVGEAHLRRAAKILQVCAPVRIAPDLGAALWGKLIANAAVNPVSAIAGQTVGTTLRTRSWVRLCAGLVAEGLRVAQAAGIGVTADDLLGIEPHRFTEPDDSLLTDVVAAHAGVAHLRSTMCRDVEDGRTTEVEWINGEIIRQGHQMNVGTPLHRSIVATIRRLEAARSTGRHLDASPTPPVASNHPDHTEGR
ncbi:MAG TPA: 2-dehydropantoate 2-reductase [Micromonosporaceae bacterium]